jgi:hypothetical protein
MFNGPCNAHCMSRYVTCTAVHLRRIFRYTLHMVSLQLLFLFVLFRRFSSPQGGMDLFFNSTRCFKTLYGWRGFSELRSSPSDLRDSFSPQLLLTLRSIILDLGVRKLLRHNICPHDKWPDRLIYALAIGSQMMLGVEMLLQLPPGFTKQFDGEDIEIEWYDTCNSLPDPWSAIIRYIRMTSLCRSGNQDNPQPECIDSTRWVGKSDIRGRRGTIFLCNEMSYIIKSPV